MVPNAFPIKKTSLLLPIKAGFCFRKWGFLALQLQPLQFAFTWNKDSIIFKAEIGTLLPSLNITPFKY